MSFQQNDYSQFGHNMQNSESNWAGIIPSLSPASPFHQPLRGSGFVSNDNFIVDDFLLPSTSMELTNLGSSLQDFKGILSNTSTTFENQNHYTYHGDQSSDLSLKKFINLSIPSYTTDIDTEGKYTSFTILVQTAFASISIKRRYKNFLALHQDLTTKVPKEILPQLPKKKRLGILDPLFVEERRSSLEKYLQDLTTLRSCWSCPHLIQFLDDHPPVLFLQIQTAKLNDEVHFLRYQNESLISQYQETTTALNSANLMITDLHKRMIEWEEILKRGSFYQRDHNQYNLVDQHNNNNNNNNNNTRGMGSYKNTIQNQYSNVIPMSVISEPVHQINRTSLPPPSTTSAGTTITPVGNIISNTTGIIIPTSSIVAPPLQTTSPLVTIADPNSSHSKFLKNVSLHSNERQQQQQYVPEELLNWQHISNDSRNINNNNNNNVGNIINPNISHHHQQPIDRVNYSDHIEPSILNSSIPYANQDIISTKENSIIQNGRRKSYTYSVSSTNVLELLSVCGVPTYLERFTNNILSYILPSFEQLQYRFQIEKYVAKLVRKSLGAQIHQMGIHSLRCFLPDDPISLSIYLCRGLEHSWYLRLNEKLCRMSSGIANSPHPGNQIQSPQPISSVLGGMTGIAKGLSDNPKIELQETMINLNTNTITTTTPSSSSSIATTTTTVAAATAANSTSTPTLGHIISNVSFMNEHGIHSLQCLVANMTVDIRVNIKLDLCFYAFLEEFDRLIGRDHLFKKSLCLIRNWWTLEVPNEAETILSTHYIPIDSICIMVCAIFNRFYRRIYHPIQAFCIFVAEYASFDWQSYALTIFGPILRTSLTEEGLLQDSYYDIYPDSLITPQLIGKYQELYNEPINLTSTNDLENNPLISLDSIGNYEIISSSNHSPEKDSLLNTNPISFATITANNNNNSNSNSTTSSPIINISSNINTNNSNLTSTITTSISTTNTTTSTTNTPTTIKTFGSGLGALFERVEEDNENELEENQEEITNSRSELKIMSSDCVKIFHPLDKSLNTVPDSMTNHLISIFTDIMKRGESKILSMLHVLILFEKTPGDILVYDQLESLTKNIFKETISRFGHGWKPDLPTPLINEIAIEAEPLMEEFINEISRDQLTSHLDNMLDLIKYTHFLASAEVTESALKTLSKDILQERGPLPVGEIGKMLQEITGISTLSAFLKDKFGGLKKFLEIFPDDFLISTDHPFNPHVFFRTSVSSDELKLINQGIIPQHLTTKTNKRRPSRKKRLSSGSLQSSLPSELNMSTISYGSGSSARSGSSGVSRSSSPPLGQGYSPSQYFHSNSPLRPNFYPQQGRGNMYPLTRTQSSSDTDRIMIAPGLSLDYEQHQIDGNYEKNSRRNIRHVDPYNDEEELPTFNSQPNLHPRRRRTVPGSTLNLDAGIISVAPGIDGPIAAGLSNNTINNHYPQVVIPDHRGINYVPNSFRNR